MKTVYLDKTLSKEINISNIKFDSNLLSEYYRYKNIITDRLKSIKTTNNEIFNYIVKSNNLDLEHDVKGRFFRQSTKSSFAIEGIDINDSIFDTTVEKIIKRHSVNNEKEFLCSKDSKYAKDIENYAAKMKSTLLLQDSKEFKLTVNNLKWVHGVLFSKANDYSKYGCWGEYMPGKYKDLPRGVETVYKNKSYFIEFIAFNQLHAYSIEKKPEQYEEVNKIIDSYINELFKFVKNSTFDPIITYSILHAQLVSIHPFFDGNGRAVRLFAAKYLNIASDFYIIPDIGINLNREGYYNALNNFHFTGHYEVFINFIIQSMIESAKELLKIIDEITNGYNVFLTKFKKDNIIRFEEVAKNLSRLLSSGVSFKEKDLYVYVGNKLKGDRRTYRTYLQHYLKNKSIKVSKNAHNEKVYIRNNNV